jgi:hypothetical protein
MLYRLIPQAEFKPFGKFFQNRRNCTQNEAEQSNRTLSHPKKSQLMIHRLYIDDVEQPDAIRPQLIPQPLNPLRISQRVNDVLREPHASDLMTSNNLASHEPSNSFP